MSIRTLPAAHKIRPVVTVQSPYTDTGRLSCKVPPSRSPATPTPLPPGSTACFIFYLHQVENGFK